MTDEARWLALFLPRLATDRLKRAAPTLRDERALALYDKIGNAFELTAVDAGASKAGLRAGMPLADARAILPALTVFEADAEEDARALNAIAAWCERYSPVVVLDAPYGLFLDITGCAHLFGGEAELRAGMLERLAAQGFTARAAIAPTPGAAWALARFAKEEASIIPPLPCGEGKRGDVLAALTRLPVEALRLDPEAAALVKRLGLKTIGQFAAAPSISLSARAGEHASLRLAQALGHAREALTPRRPHPPVTALRRFLEPLFNVDTMLIATQALCGDIVAKLDRRGGGALRLCLHLYGVDGRDRTIEIGVSRPERDAKAMLRLFREKLNLAAENLNAEFGIEAARLDVVQLQRVEATARTLAAVEEVAGGAENIASLVDVLSARLGPARVLRGKLNDAHAPERAGGWRSVLNASLIACGGGAGEEGRTNNCAVESSNSTQMPSTLALGSRPLPPSASPQGRGGEVLRRPLTLFARAQPIEALATVPDGPPVRFRWRRVQREVVRAEGPERIAGDWLRGEPTRDYYRIEDNEGRRYWLYREGLYGEAQEPRWFMHGLFA